MRVKVLVSCTTDFVLYSTVTRQSINIGDDPSKQCASNRTGILCGACIEGFSLAIGSFRCIECPNSHNVALLLAFAAAGVLLVFFILALNLTATQGFINGVIFYANIVWAYKIILFPADIGAFTFLQVFIAWPGSIWILESRLVSLLDWMLIGRYGWNLDLFLCWTGCLLEDMAAVSIPILHLGHCWCYHWAFPLIKDTPPRKTNNYFLTV